MTKNKNTNFQYIPLGSFINIPFTLTVKNTVGNRQSVSLNLQCSEHNSMVHALTISMGWHT